MAAGFTAKFDESSGVSFIASEKAQPAIIGQLGIMSLPGLKSCLAGVECGQQSIAVVIAMPCPDCTETICSAIIAQCGAIAIAALWPKRPMRAPISNAR